MIRMACLPIGKDDDSRPLLPQHSHNLQAILPGVFDTPVGNVQGVPPTDIENLGCFSGLAFSIFGGASGAHLATREIENAGTAAALGHFKQSTAAGLLHVVAVSSNGQNVNRITHRRSFPRCGEGRIY